MYEIQIIWQFFVLIWIRGPMLPKMPAYCYVMHLNFVLCIKCHIV